MLRTLVLAYLLSISFAWAQVTKVASVGFTVKDLDRQVEFFEDVLHFKKVAEYSLDRQSSEALFGLETDGTRIAVLRLGDETLQLMHFEGTTGREIPRTSKSNDLWFQHIAIVVSDMQEAYRRIREHDLQFVSSSPQTLPDYLPAAAGITAFYFQDPEGHVLELIQFPEGKGNPKWQAKNGQLFMGIDHSAIGIDKTSVSLPFYTDILGLKKGGNSENYGTEQEHLNQVFGAHLIITGLHAGEGIGVEFLDYLSPPGGLAYPADSNPADLWHWNYFLETADLEGMYRGLQESKAPFISKGIVEVVPSQKGQAIKAVMLRDPDGHALMIYQNKNKNQNQNQKTKS
jgi:catechol 2,3-dioxygenase-like lactoylglutathione lyase family enzyme